MRKKAKLRLISLFMLAAAVIFVLCALACPTCGRAITIGSLRIGGDIWRKCYTAYVIIMFGLFIASFFIKSKK